MKKINQTIKQLRSKPRFNLIVMLGVIIVFIIVGYFVIKSKAALPAASIPTNNQGLSGNGAYCTDSTTNGGGYVQFGSTTNNPTPTILTPGTNATLSGTVALVADVANVVSGKKVLFFRDNFTLIGEATPSLGYIYNWDTTKAANGDHKIAVATYNSANQLCFSPIISVGINNNSNSFNSERLGISPGEPYLADGLTNASYMAKVAELGIRWVRLDANLAQATNFMDGAITEAKNKNLKVLAVFTYGDTSNVSALADKAISYVDHWRSLNLLGTIGAYEIWNEPNNTYIQFVQPNDLADLMSNLYPRLKAASPNLPIIAGGFSPGGGNSACCNGNQANPADYLNQLYQANGGSSAGMFDAAANHPYNTVSYPSGNVGNSGIRNTAYLRNVMNSYGDAAKEIWATETGWPSCGGYGSNSPGFSEEQRTVRFNSDLREWFYGQHSPDGSFNGTYSTDSDWNTGPFIIFKLYKTGLAQRSDPTADNLGLIYTPTKNCDGKAAWYEPPIVGAVKLLAKSRQ